MTLNIKPHLDLLHNIGVTVSYIEIALQIATFNV